MFLVGVTVGVIDVYGLGPLLPASLPPAALALDVKFPPHLQLEFRGLLLASSLRFAAAAAAAAAADVSARQAGRLYMLPYTLLDKPRPPCSLPLQLFTAASRRTAPVCGCIATIHSHTHTHTHSVYYLVYIHIRCVYILYISGREQQREASKIIRVGSALCSALLSAQLSSNGAKRRDSERSRKSEIIFKMTLNLQFVLCVHVCTLSSAAVQFNISTFALKHHGG